MKRRWQDPAWREKITRSSTGRRHTDSAKRQMSEQKALWWATHDTTETKTRIGAKSKGRPGKRGSESHWWKGGRWKVQRDGYIYIQVPDHPFGKKNGKGHGNYLLEHRFVMEQHIGRFLRLDEDVHHINGVKDDNRIDNLRLVSHDRHYDNVICPHCRFIFRVQ